MRSTVWVQDKAKYCFNDGRRKGVTCAMSGRNGGVFEGQAPFPLSLESKIPHSHRTASLIADLPDFVLHGGLGYNVGNWSFCLLICRFSNTS